MYLDTVEIECPPAPPDVSVVKGIILSYSFLFLGTPGHYYMRKYSCWCKTCSLLCGCGNDCVSRGNLLDVSVNDCVSRGNLLDVSVCLRSKFTVLKDAGNDTSCEKQFNLSHHTWEDYRSTRFYKQYHAGFKLTEGSSSSII